MVLKASSSLASKIRETKEAMKHRSLNNLLGAAVIWHGGVVNGQLTGSRSGRMYTIPGTKRKYRASSPGQAPASRTGTLRSGYRFRVVDRGPFSTGEVGSPETYALWLEKGTKNMAARPHLEPAFHAKKAEIYRELGKRWDK